MRAAYLDSSAIVRLAVREAESDALRAYLRRRPSLVTSALARTEVARALLPAGHGALAAGRKVLARLDLVRVTNRVLEEAATLLPSAIRSLEAIHLATAGQLGEDLESLLTYDGRMAEAARRLGHHVVTPR